MNKDQVKERLKEMLGDYDSPPEFILSSFMAESTAGMIFDDRDIESVIDLLRGMDKPYYPHDASFDTLFDIFWDEYFMNEDDLDVTEEELNILFSDFLENFNMKEEDNG